MPFKFQGLVERAQTAPGAAGDLTAREARRAAVAGPHVGTDAMLSAALQSPTHQAARSLLVSIGGKDAASLAYLDQAARAAALGNSLAGRDERDVQAALSRTAPPADPRQIAAARQQVRAAGVAAHATANDPERDPSERAHARAVLGALRGLQASLGL